MSRNKKNEIKIFYDSTPIDIQRAMNRIVDDLENYGRTRTDNGNAVKFFSRCAKDIDREILWFSRNQTTGKSTIALKPKTKIKRFGAKIRFLEGLNKN